MNNEAGGKTHRSFWLIGAIALVYNIAGGVNFFMQMNADAVAAMPELYRTFIEGRPGWVTSAFAVAVLGGAFGCVLLLLKRPIAYYVFVASLLAAIGTLVSTLDTTNALSNPLVVGNLVQVAVTVFLIWYSKRAESRGWLKTNS